MAPTFERDDDLCKRYAQFASELDRWHFKIIYWLMFMLNLVVLFVASWAYTSGQDAIDKYRDDQQKCKRSLRKYLTMCLACVLASAVTVVMEAYALLALQFCDGENLMSLYWSTWTMIQVGSLIAMVGIILAFSHALNNRRHPPWALALGTPVLVIAGLLHLLHDSLRKRLRKKRGSDDTANGGDPLSESNTIQGGPEEDAEDPTQTALIGFTVEGGPIVRFNNALRLPRSLSSSRYVLLGYSEDGRPIVSYVKEYVRFTPASDREGVDGSAEAKPREKEKSAEIPENDGA